MKQKIKEALQQRHKNLGLSDEVFERVAASVETFITDEGAIDGFVQSENTLNLLKSYQSVNDKLRSLEKKNSEKKEDVVEKPSEPEIEKPEPKEEPAVQQDLKAAIADLLKEVVEPIKEELATFKKSQSAKSAFTEAEAAFHGNDYVKKYADEAEEAWERATELYEATGKEWSAEELGKRAMAYFNKKVSKRGVDTTKPLPSEGSGDQIPDFKGEAEHLRSLGIDIPE